MLQGLLSMMAYSFLLSIAGLFTNMQDDAMRVNNLDKARKCRAVVSTTLLLSIAPFVYIVTHFQP